MILTIYTKDKTLEYEFKGRRHSQYRVGGVVDFTMHDPKTGEFIELIKIRPYYRRRINGTMHVFCEIEGEA